MKSQQELGVILRRKGDLPGAERYLTNCVTVRIRDYGESAVWTIESIIELGWLRADQRRLNEARSHFQRALALAEVELSSEHPVALSARHGLGVVALKEQQFQNAEPLLRSALEGKLKVHGADYPGTVAVRLDLAALYEAWGRTDEFERWYDEFERWREGRRRGYLRSRYLYPGAALIGLGVAIWYFGPRREAPSAGS